MKTLFVLLMLLFATAASADIPVPKCYPEQLTCGKAYSALIVEGAVQPFESLGRCVQWYQIDDSGDFYEAVGYCERWSDDMPNPEPITGDALWNEYVARNLDEVETRVWNGLLIHQPLSVYAVPPNGTATTRPTYKVVNGVRQSSSNGRIAIGSICRPSILKIGSYADVSGQINSSTGSPLPANTVASCAKR